ncbi:MAG: lipid-A-disaccharide synthase [Desulfuromonadales bacterium]|nr:lipid-A-disaccharide synthase [Desulfuromonadales bacterium]
MSVLTTKKAQRVLIVAGEPSGDLHAANMIQAARVINPGLSFFGVTGPKMRAAGCETLLCYDEISVMGFVEVIGRLPAIRRAFKRVTAAFISEQRPDLLILVDFPGFNMRLARAAKKAGIPILYYIAPKVWAWRQGRAKTLAATVDRMAVIFPFEPEFYKPYGLQADYVGNPLLDDYAASLKVKTDLKGFNDTAGEQIVGLFPGSRRSEIRYNLDTMLQAARLLSAERPELKFVLPLASSLDRAEIAAQITASGLAVEIVENDIYTVAAACSAVLAVSGTVTLQIALTGTPLAVMYRTSAISAAIARQVVKIPYVSLVNIIAGREVVREFLQEDATPEKLAAEMLKILDDPDCKAQICSGLDEVRKLMGAPGCSLKVAEIVQEMTGESYEKS